MNRRIHPRFDLMPFPLYVDIIDGFNELYLGKVKDISKGGVSFYTSKKSLVSNEHRTVEIILFLEAKQYTFEVEILREIKTEDGQTIHAGQFKGVPSEIKHTFPHTLNESVQRELAYL